MLIPRRVLAYARVSGQEQGRSGTSLDAQREEILRHCAAHGLPSPRFFVEIESAGAEKLDRRAQLIALMAEVREGDLVIVSKQDRWSRDTLFYLQSTRDIMARGARFLSLAERFDPSTPEGVFASTIMAAVAEQERGRIRERTVGRRREMRDQGCWTEATVPFGYRRDPQTRRLVILESEALIVREVFARSLLGQSIQAIAHDMRARQIGRQGGKPIGWDKKAVHSLLRARWYLGDIRRTSGAWEPAHPAIVDRGTFERVQKALETRRKGGCTPGASSRTAAWLLRGLSVCGSCGARMGAAYSRATAKDGYYACNARLRGDDCDEVYVKVSTTDASVSALAVRRLEELREALASQKMDHGGRGDIARLEALRRGLESVKTRRERLLSIAVEGLVTPGELRQRLAKLDSERAHTEAAIAEEEKRVQPISDAVRVDVLREISMLRRGWQKATMAERREILALLAERIQFANGVPTITWASVDSVCEASVGSSLFGATDAKSLNGPKKARKRA